VWLVLVLICTYRDVLQVKGSGIANTCPVIEGGSTNLKDLKSGTYK
jgi:hypothetical protein